MEGKKSIVYPALERVQRDLFGVCVVDTSGTVYAAGDAEYEFTIMSVDLAKLRDQSSYVIQRTGGTGIRAACS